jgi:biopolymer transport protein ExbD
MKLHRTKEYNFGWMMIIPAVDILFLLIFFVLLSSNFILQPGIAVALCLAVWNC